MMFYISVKVHRFFTSVLPAWQSNQRERNEEVVEHLALSPGDCSPIKTLRNWRWFLWWVFCVEKKFKPTMKMCVPKRRFWLDLDRWTTPGRISLFFLALGVWLANWAMLRTLAEDMWNLFFGIIAIPVCVCFVTTIVTFIFFKLFAHVACQWFLTFLYTIFIGSDYVLRQVVVPRIAGISQQVCFNGDSLWLVSSSED